ncbi:multidrug efflux pump subunit AcrA (membrane-fusion protein) [Variovorax boronicumulans]|uniref:hypothetical protein n=1 Tax=Variovorax boronicumulans TaxID=436515 RepID=UPI0027868517|nr:hypothetical protein [Variovorax boronicumulans]MDQ0086067.1 multidrug efflux pump subunit AcrA (membrane-fusion protein) [Variovorax boronicumulans]
MKKLFGLPAIPLLISLICAAILTVAGGWYFSARDARLSAGLTGDGDIPTAARGALPGVEVGAAREMPMRQKWSGRLIPLQRQQVNATSDAEVVESYLAHGRSFRAGELMLRLRDPVLFNEHLTGQRKIERLRFNLNTEPTEVLRAQQSANRAKVELSRVRAELAPQRELFDRGLIARVELRSLEQREQDAKDQLDAATRELQTARSQATLSRADWQSELAALEQAQQGLKKRLAALEVRAPFDGKVTWFSDAVATGTVKRGMELLQFESTAGVQAELRLIRNAETEKLFAVGNTVLLALHGGASPAGSLPNADLAPQWLAGVEASNDGAEAQLGAIHLQGKVDTLGALQAASDGSAAGSASATLVVRVMIDPQEWAQLDATASAAWGVGVDVDAWVQRITKVVEIPMATVARRSERTYTYVQTGHVRGNVWNRREVFGAEDGKGNFLVAAGLAPGEKVALLR